MASNIPHYLIVDISGICDVIYYVERTPDRIIPPRLPVGYLPRDSALQSDCGGL